MPNQHVALITGASSGIGQSTARRLVDRGFTVFGTSRDPARAQAVQGADLLPLDVRDDASVRACVAAVMTQAGRLDILVNNAGYVLGGAIEEVSIEEARAQFETNFFGVVRMVKAVLPSMRMRRSGHIITISSLAGLVPAPPFWGIYSASKYALESYSEHLWREVKPFNVRVSLVEPGPIKTNLTRNQHNAAVSIDDYAARRQRAFDAARKSEQEAPGPDLVADCVVRIVNSKAPKVRYRVGKEATWVPRLRHLLPVAWFEQGLSKTFNLEGKR